MEQEEKIIVRYRRNRQQIQALLNEFEKSNLGIKDFCRERNIYPAIFHKWRSRYKSNLVGKKKTSGFATLDVVDSPSAIQGLFAEVKGIKIYRPVSASFLKELLA